MTSIKSTDVPASIAGYYYQTLLAIRELSNLTNDDDAVGIEKGADVRVFIKSGKNVSIEAKFYSKEIDRNSYAVTHTIFNFYNNSTQEDALFFETNVVINDELLIEISNINNIKDVKDEHIKYVSIAIMKELKEHKVNITGRSGQVHTNTIKQLFKEYLVEESKSTDSSIKFSKNFKEEHYEFYYEMYKDNPIIDFFGVRIEKNKIKILIQKIVFKYGTNKLKYNTIKELKTEIINNIRPFNVENCHLENTIKVLIDKFLETTLDNKDTQLVTLLDLKIIIENFKDNDYKLNLKFYNEDFIKKLEAFDAEFQESIEDSYSGIKSDELIERYILVREMICGLIRVGDYKYPEDFLKQYSLGLVNLHTFDELIKLITIVSVFDNIDLDMIGFCESRLENLNINNEIICYKKHVDGKRSEVVLKEFIRKTLDSIPSNDQNKNPLIIFSGSMPDFERPCQIDIKNESVLRITEVKGNKELIKYYKNLDYKCNGCIYFYKNDLKAQEYINKFNSCRGWKSWESIN